ncbi:MAG: CDP-alcohol phosphatidyltransferase family protein [Bacteroidales bacterium]|nr:CDP-alcohol phosphatidyltransferase family protein [Bacteroidales bacterium]
MNKELRYFTLPNILTLFNLIAGSFALFFAFEKSGEQLYVASIFILIAIVFDFLDGFVARLTDSVSKIGKQLDSLADIVSFGIAPAVIVFQMLKGALEIKDFSLDLPFTDILLMMMPVLLIVAAALRLAKFTADDKQKTVFLGLATPVSALFFASLPLLDMFDPDNLLILKVWLDVNLPFDFILAIIGLQVFILTSVWFFTVSIVVISILQLINLPMFSFKFEGYSFKKNATKYVFIILSFLLIIFLQCFIIPFVVVLYILFSAGDDVVGLFIKKK